MTSFSKIFFVFIFLLSCTGGILSAQTYEELIAKSYDYMEGNDLVSAEMSLKEAMRIEPANPNNYALLSNMGTIQRRQGKREEALASYTIALARFPKSTMILSNRASLYLEMNETDKALNDYNIILIEDSVNQDALYNRGMIYLQKKNFIWAEQDFDRIIEINEATLYGRLGHAVLEKVRKNYDESERIYNYLINRMPHEIQLYRGRADLYFLMGKNARAMADINKIFAESEPDAGLYILRGKIKLAQYERPSAAKDFTKAKEMGYDPEVVDELLRMAK